MWIQGHIEDIVWLWIYYKKLQMFAEVFSVNHFLMDIEF